MRRADDIAVSEVQLEVFVDDLEDGLILQDHRDLDPSVLGPAFVGRVARHRPRLSVAGCAEVLGVSAQFGVSAGEQVVQNGIGSVRGKCPVVYIRADIVRVTGDDYRIDVFGVLLIGQKLGKYIYKLIEDSFAVLFYFI